MKEMKNEGVTIKLCKDCKHASRFLFGFISAGEHAYCKRAPESIDPVTGEASYYYCATQRDDLLADDPDMCGPGARFFEPRKIKK